MLEPMSSGELEKLSVDLAADPFDGVAPIFWHVSARRAYNVIPRLLATLDAEKERSLSLLKRAEIAEEIVRDVFNRGRIPPQSQVLGDDQFSIPHEV